MHARNFPSTESSNSTPERAGSGPVADRMLYFVLADFGEAGHAFVETDIASNSLRQVIVDIAKGEISRPVQILECNPAERICNDVTEHVAREVYSRLSDSGDGCPDRLRDFIDDNLNAGDADRLDMAAGVFDSAGAEADRRKRFVTELATRIRQAAE
jgi:hypothetical protein